MQFQVESTEQNKKAYHVDLSKNFKQNLKESNECSPIWNRRKEWQRAREKEEHYSYSYSRGRAPWLIDGPAWPNL